MFAYIAGATFVLQRIYGLSPQGFSLAFAVNSLGIMTAAQVSARLLPTGRVLLQCATTDIGPGTGTAMTQIAADTLGLPPDQITAKLGDSDLPTSPVEGGSWD